LIISIKQWPSLLSGLTEGGRCKHKVRI